MPPAHTREEKLTAAIAMAIARKASPETRTFDKMVIFSATRRTPANARVR